MNESEKLTVCIQVSINLFIIERGIFLTIFTADGAAVEYNGK